MNTKEIIDALKMGKAVYYRTPNYFLTYRAHTDELFIVCAANNYMVGLGRWHCGSDFYIGEGAK